MLSVGKYGVFAPPVFVHFIKNRGANLVFSHNFLLYLFPVAVAAVSHHTSYAPRID